MAIAMGLIIANALALSGMTQRALAEKIGVKESAISHYIKGDRTPRGAILTGIANTLRIPLEDLTDKISLPEEVNQLDYDKVFNFLAVYGKQLSTEQKRKILELLM